MPIAKRLAAVGLASMRTKCIPKLDESILICTVIRTSEDYGQNSTKQAHLAINLFDIKLTYSNVINKIRSDRIASGARTFYQNSHVCHVNPELASFLKIETSTYNHY